MAGSEGFKLSVVWDFGFPLRGYLQSMRLGKGQRKIVWVIGSVALAVIVLCLTLPLWFPSILKPLAAKVGANYVRYERLGYAQFALEGFTFTNRTTHFRAARVKALTPIVWLWKLTAGDHQHQPAFLQLTGCEFESLPGPDNKAQAQPSAYEELQKLEATRRQLRRWLPSASLSNGTLRIGKTPLAVRDMRLESGNLQATATVAFQGQQALLIGMVNGTQPLEFRLHSERLALDSVIRLFTNASGFEMQSTNFWWTNRIDLIAHFGKTGLLPETADLNIAEFQFPASAVHLPGYTSVNGSLSANWQNGQFALDLRARGEPLRNQTKLPPVDIVLHARGTTNSATIETAEISSPWISAQLSREAPVSFNGRLLREPVALNFKADLAKQQLLPLNGLLQGHVLLSPGDSKFPRAVFELFGSEIGTDAIKARTLSLDALCYWPWLEISNAKASFEDGSLAFGTGKMDLESKLLSAGTVSFQGPLVRRWLPGGYSYEGLSFNAHLEGPLRQLSHAGQLDATNVTTPYLHPMLLHVDWHGRQEQLQQFDAVVTSGNSSLSAAGAVSLTKDQTDLQLSAFSLSTNRQPLLELKEPSWISLHHAKSQKDWEIVLSSFDLSGAGGDLAAQAAIKWPGEGALRFSARNLASTNFADFIKSAVPELNLQNLTAAASWTNSPVRLQMEISATGRAQSHSVASTNQTAQSSKGRISRSRKRLTSQSLLTTPLSCEAKIAADESGITLSNVVVRSQETEELAIRGFVPLTINPANATNFVAIEPNQPVRLNATVQPQAFIWGTLEDQTGLILQEPQLHVAISGTLEALQGQVKLSAQELELENPPSPMPTLTDLHLQLQLDREQAHLIDAGLLVQGQPINLIGQMPLGEGFWTGLKHKKPPDWGQAIARLRIKNAQIAALAPLFPNLITPQGQLDVDASLSRGAKLEGTLAIQHARSRPLGEFGPINDINVNLRLANNILQLEHASAKLSSAELLLSGGADLHGNSWLKGVSPPFELSLRGTEVPLAHQPDLIVRGDLLLAITKTNNASPLISGVVHLHDSFFLSDLSALVPGKVAKPNARPPYFSIEEPPFADWRLAVAVDGPKFMRIRSSLFGGEISVNVNLQGTLKDPIALGNLRIDSGLVRFPFANLQVQQGLINLNSQNPYHPDLLVSATSKQFGYDVRMEVSGKADAPIVQFTSNPPLSSEQIVLLITSGQMPQGAYTLTPQQRAQTVALFLGRDMLSKLGFGDQSQQRLTIRSGEQISDQGKPTYNIEYRLSDRWTLTGEYDRFADYNVGFKWLIYSR